MSEKERAELIWADLIISGKAALEKNRKAFAESQFRLALEQCKHFDEEAQRVAETLSCLVKCIDLGERPLEAEDTYRKIISARERSQQATLEEVVEPMESLAFILFRKGETDEAVQLQNAAISLQETHCGKYTTEALKSLEIAYWNARRFLSESESEVIKDELLLRLDYAMQLISDLDDQSQYETVWALAAIYDGLNMKDTSANILLSCLQFTRQKFGEGSQQLGRCLLDIANTSSISCENAVIYLLEGISIFEHLNEDESILLMALKNLSEMYALNKKLDQAIGVRIRLIDLKEQAIVCDNYALYPDYQALANLYINQENYTFALQAFERAIEIIEETTGTDGEDLANLLLDAARSLDKENKPVAENFYKRALSICENIFGFEHPKVADALSDLGGFYMYNGKSAQAEPLLLRALTANRKIYGETNHRVGYNVLNLGHIYTDRNDLRAAEEILQSNVKVVERLKRNTQQKQPIEKEIGFQHFQLGIISLLATIYLKQQKFSDAKPLFEEIIKILTASAVGDMRAFNATFSLAICDHNLNHLALAESNYRRCLAILENNSRQQTDVKDIVIDRLVEVLRSTNKHIEANELANCKSGRSAS